MSDTRQHVHDLIDRLPRPQLDAIAGLLEAMIDPVVHAIAAALINEEPLSQEDKKALAEARKWAKHNKGIPHEQVLAELGITQDEIDNYKETT